MKRLKLVIRIQRSLDLQFEKLAWVRFTDNKSNPEFTIGIGSFIINKYEEVKDTWSSSIDVVTNHKDNKYYAGFRGDTFTVLFKDGSSKVFSIKNADVDLTTTLEPAKILPIIEETYSHLLKEIDTYIKTCRINSLDITKTISIESILDA